jgi:hypothetical protein
MEYHGAPTAQFQIGSEIVSEVILESNFGTFVSPAHLSLRLAITFTRITGASGICISLLAAYCISTARCSNVVEGVGIYHAIMLTD